MNGSNWTIGNFLSNLFTQGSTWVNYIIVILGVVLLGMAVYRLVTKLLSKGGGQEVSWFKIIGMFGVGAVLFGFGVSGGLSGIQGYGDIVGNTIGDLGKPTILLSYLLG